MHFHWCATLSFLATGLLLAPGGFVRAEAHGGPGACAFHYDNLLPESPADTEEKLRELYPRFLRAARAKRELPAEKRRALALEILDLAHRHLDNQGVPHVLREEEGRTFIEITPAAEPLFNRAARGNLKYSPRSTVVFDPEDLLETKARAIYTDADKRLTTSFLSILRASPNEPSFKHETVHAVTDFNRERGRPNIWGAESSILDEEGVSLELPGPNFRAYRTFMSWDELLAHAVGVREYGREYKAWIKAGRPASGSEAEADLRRALRNARRVQRRGIALSRQLQETVSSLSAHRNGLPIDGKAERRIPLLGGKRWQVEASAEEVETELGHPIVRLLIKLAPAIREAGAASEIAYETAFAFPMAAVQNGELPYALVLAELRKVEVEAEKNLRHFRSVKILSP